MGPLQKTLLTASVRHVQWHVDEQIPWIFVVGAYWRSHAKVLCSQAGIPEATTEAKLFRSPKASTPSAPGRN
jgi:hypothetical protein